MSTIEKYPNLKPFPKGVSGNPSGLPGRPVGSRQAFSAGFLTDLAQVWRQHGKDTIVHTAKTQPAVFFATCARLIGPEVKLTIEQSQPVLVPLTSRSFEQSGLKSLMPIRSHRLRCLPMSRRRFGSTAAR